MGTKPIAKLTFSTAQLPPQKTVAVLVISQELLRVANSRIFQSELTRAVAEATDAAFIARITAGAPSTGSAGSTASAILADISAGLRNLNLDAASMVFVITSPTIAKDMAVVGSGSQLLFPGLGVNGGTLQGMTVIASNAVSGQLVFVDATQIVAAAGGVELDAATEATVQLDTAPDSPPSASTSYVSLWQQNFAGLRCERYWSAAVARANAVSIVAGVNYSTGGSP